MIKHLFLVQIRLSSYFWILFSIYLAASVALPSFKFDSSALTLFSVNSFLYGFYIAPILSAQKARIEELHRIVRAESNALFGIMLHFKKLPKDFRTEMQDHVRKYVNAKLKHKAATGGEAE